MNGNGTRPGENATGPLVREYRPTGRYKRPSGQVAAVLLYENGGYSVVWPDRREDVDKPLIRGPYTVFEVRMGWHITKFGTELPAAGGAESFRAEVEVRWRVADPHLVVTSLVWDVAEHFSPVLLHALRGVTRRFRIDEAEEADRAVQDQLLETGDLDPGAEFGLETRVFVRIDLSDRGVQAKQELSAVEQTREVERRRHALEVERERQEQEINRMRARELQEVLSSGDEFRIAWFMGRDKEQAWRIHQEIRKEQRADRELSIETVFRFVDGGLIERQDLSDQTLAAIDFLRSATVRARSHAVDGIFQEADRRLEEDGSRRSARERRQLEWREPAAEPRDHGDGASDARDSRDSRDGRGEDRADRGAHTDRDGYGDGYADRDGHGDGPGDGDGYGDREAGRVHEPTRVEPGAARTRDGARRRWSANLDWGDE
ncbi:hypothetical protein [Streptomyces macrosporus]|uniref:PE-PGRS family protein n=1 Tax=Streptomyces macrosporus TaxID=44032 RepID=A0ABP5XCT1_9ACTN